MRLLIGLPVLIVLEIWVLFEVGSRIGFLGLLGLLILSAVVGAWAIKHEGRRSMTALVEATRARRPAEAEVADGMYIALAGILLVVPGMITTAIALVLLVPPVRRALAKRAAARAVRAGSARQFGQHGPGFTVVNVGPVPPGSPYGPGGGPGPTTPRRIPSGSGPVIEGEVVESPGADEPGSTRSRPAGE